MPTRYTESLLQLPLFAELSSEQLETLLGCFERIELEPGAVLHEAGTNATHLHVLVEGRVELKEDDEVRFSLNPPAPIGELGVVTRGLKRNTTAVAAEPSVALQTSRERLQAFLAANSEIAFRVYQNLLDVVSDKIRRDETRISEMRSNIIRTQKAMKALREQVLEQPETPISSVVHDVLESCIKRNRRANYNIEPPKALPASVRTGDGKLHRVLAIARNHVSLPKDAVGDNGQWKGVLVIPSTEIPLSGSVRPGRDGSALVELDLLLDDYAAALEDYLTRAQMLDVVV